MTRALFASLLSVWGCECAKPMDPGVLFEIDPAIVTTLEYETSELYVTAHRFAERERFHVVVQAKGDNEITQCKRDANLATALLPFESLTIVRRLDDSELTKLGKRRIYHRLRVVSAPPMQAYEEVLTPLANGALSLESDGFAYELSLSTKAVDQLRHVCQ
jgi:hypothetical protein